MENLTVEAVITFVSIAFPVAVFLLNSNRVQKAIEMCSERLILLNNANQNRENQFILLPYGAIYKVLF